MLKLDAPVPEDRRKFEAVPDDLWQSDFMHGPMVAHEGKRRKTYLIVFIDTLHDLNLALSLWLSDIYHSRKHTFVTRRSYVPHLVRVLPISEPATGTMRKESSIQIV